MSAAEPTLAPPPARTPSRIQAWRASHWLHAWALPIAIPIYWFALARVGGLTALHLVLTLPCLFLSVWSDGSRRLARVVFPCILYGIVYDSMRWYADAIRAPHIYTREPYDFDKAWFGIRTALGVITPNEWTQQHTVAALDFITGLAYTPFFFIGESALLILWFWTRGQERWAERFTWVFVWCNFIGFSFYYWLPAAPPWYVAAHGFDVDLSVRASPAGALRFDDLVGYPIMAGFYGKSADVFGAIPSLHIVYPLVALAYGWKLPKMRPWLVAYFLLVCFSAVYLNHHYILDILVGAAIAFVVMWAARWLYGPAQWQAAQA